MSEEEASVLRAPSTGGLRWQLTPAAPGPPPRWVELLDHIDVEVTALARDQFVWRTVAGIAGRSEVVREQPYFVQWVADQYARGQALGVRRLVDGDPRTASFRRLFMAMQADPSALTRAWFCGDADILVAEKMNQTFTRRAGNGPSLDPKVVESDLDALDRASGKVAKFVNEQIAHAQHVPKAAVPAMTDVDDAVALLGQLLVKYTLLLKRVYLDPVTPVFQMPWHIVFTHWINEPVTAEQLPT